MARYKISPNLEKYNKMIYDWGQYASTYIEKAVKEGANPVADAVRYTINSLPTDDRYARDGMILNGPRALQKAGLQASLGIAPIRYDNGFINVKVGFDGYNGIRTKKYPRGQPNSMIARSVENGTSFMSAHSFMKYAVAKSEKEAIDTMQRIIEEAAASMFGG